MAKKIYDVAGNDTMIPNILVRAIFKNDVNLLQHVQSNELKNKNLKKRY